MKKSTTRTVLVTGGCGFIGSNLVPPLVEQGHPVRVYDNPSRGRADWVAHSCAPVAQALARTAGKPGHLIEYSLQIGTSDS